MYTSTTTRKLSRRACLGFERWQALRAANNAARVSSTVIRVPWGTFTNININQGEGK